ncbi:MAG: DUF2252 domain-containing protein [Candidatus Cybelea sp.]
MMTKAARRAAGKNLRSRCPRAAHAEWTIRSDDAVAILGASDEGRIEELVPVRYGRMSLSPFAFFRGTAAIQAHDLAGSPSSGIVVQLCGDCHLMNFGGFATPERHLAFDINDFDETFPGPFEWDVKRLGVSILLAARGRNLSEGVGEEAVRASVISYRLRMAELADRTIIERWYEGIRIEDLIEHFSVHRRTERTLLKKRRQAAKRTSESVFPKLTTIVDGRAKIMDDPPLITHEYQQRLGWEERAATVIDRYKASASAELRQLLNRYEFEDAALKVVGVGSVGTHCYIALFLANGEEPLFLQMKEARRSVLEPAGPKSRFAHEGERVVYGQRLMQAAGDIFLGWTELPGERDFYVRQLRDMKISADFEKLDPRLLVNYATMCGWALARAHAKAGDADAIRGYLGRSDVFDTASVEYTKAYAVQVDRDYAAMQDAIRSGRLTAHLES